MILNKILVVAVVAVMNLYITVKCCKMWLIQSRLQLWTYDVVAI